MKINEVKELLAGQPAAEQLEALRQDERSGVQKLLAAYDKRLAKAEAERRRFEKMLRYEHIYYGKGAQYVAGVDEAGRGPLAGPLVIAAVILPQEIFISGLNDSKQLSAARRDALYDEIMEKALAIEVNIVSVSNIDAYNIYSATQRGMAAVLEHLPLRPQVALIDAMPVQAAAIETVSVIHGDALSASIAAASIIAKVTRDRIMERLDKLYPAYGFAQNKGYGSSAHMQAIAAHGATKWHRRSYEPVKSMGLPPAAAAEDILYAPQLDSYEYPVED
ncbi:MAG: ribonuclease HII [Phascolarctobacterium sp.]|uniref:ribonuclease HII n=1 Tax=Phascolarctobacterium sp. TaxID=2049039 RepID=UPI0026DA82DC|nr:ribonuclease HII [Phascolarctobacterium sp.]MDO4921503.1 ribonuclease HII [Phascolarctobacterium sp.]